MIGKIRLILRALLILPAVLCPGAAAQQVPGTAGFTPGELQLLHRLRPASGNALSGSGLTAMGSPRAGSGVALKLSLQRQADAGGRISAPAPANSSVVSLGSGGSQIGGAGSTTTASRNGHPQTPASQNQSIATARPPIANCGTLGIHDVNGQNVGAIFTPVTEYNGYASGYKSNVSLVRGCGFRPGTGKVFIDLPYDPAPAARSFSPQSPKPALQKELQLRVVSGKWTDSSILVEVDPNTSGYLATQNATLHVVTADGREYQAHNLQFYPVYEKQSLSQLPRNTRLLMPSSDRTTLRAQASGDNLAQIKDANGNPVVSHYFSPSAGSVVFDSNHTFAVLRIANASFEAGTDTFEVAGMLKDGFEIADAKMSEATLPGGSCKAPYSYETSGTWNVKYVGGQLQVSWQEQGCQWERRGGNPQTPSSVKPNILKAPAPIASLSNSSQGAGEGASAYAIDIIVNGPRGVSPLR